MQTLKYSLFAKFIYRYGNLPLDIILFFYMISAAISLNKSLIFLLPLTITALLLFFLNRHYIKMYKLMPYKISFDDEKMICENFLFSRRKVTIYFKDIKSLSGGIFEGQISGMMKVCDGKTNVCVGFYNKLKNAKVLQTQILGKVNRSVYDDVVEKVGLKKKKAEEERRKLEKFKKEKENKSKKKKK